ncbi:putative laccase-9 [Rhodamnia argentea]|uniref:Laccase n=1 Tax=Rhodamnia argentea TaxID=178133 RepID=A0A8B8MMF8_9MYRT|nr:putative laccase-9 [Rhodamnia argentea]
MKMAIVFSFSPTISLHPTILFLLANVLLLARAAVHHHDFVLRETNITRNCTTMSLLTVNGSFPGPVIRVRKGDLVFVHVHNQGDYGVTLHWHGVKQPRNPWSDGPEYITQCPIQPQTNFTYEVNFTEEEGTLWWHAHSDWTRATVHGAIVILPSEGSSFPFPEPDEEDIIVLGSWYDEEKLNEVLNEDLAAGSDVPRATGYTINGQFGDFVPCSKESTYHLFVDYGKTYLLRIVNAAVSADHFFSIAKHNMTVVGMDGAYTKPVVTSYITISPGQTMDVLLTTDQSLRRYYMAARRYSSEDTEVTAFSHINVTAILQYRGNYSLTSPPIFPSDTLPSFYDYFAAANFIAQLKSLANEEYPISVPQNISTRMFITASLNELLCANDSCAAGDSKIATSLSNISWVNPSTDVLLAYYRNISGVYTPDFPNLPPSLYNFTGDDLSTSLAVAAEGTKVKVLNFNETVEIIFQGTNLLKGSETHPMHLHGYSFYVVGSGFGNFDNETDPQGYNLIDPPKVNTFAVPKKGWITIRFTANNPGVWYWHCHIDRHMSWGMSTTFIVLNGDTEETSMRPPPSYLPPCTDTSNIALKETAGFVGDTNQI